jgi:hypothetical protein
MADKTQLNPGPSERVVSADGTLSNGADMVNRSRNRYTGVMGGWSKGHQAAHLNGKLPAGGNVLCLDGHAAWKKFVSMVVRTDGDPAFWW